MAQGAMKKAAAPTGNPAKQNKKGGNGKPASKVTKKKGKTGDKALRKFTSGMAARTEAMLGERAGHLELIGKGRKRDGLGAAVKGNKGGTRKFG